MSTLTLHFEDDSVVTKAAAAALQQNTSLEDMLREFVISMGENEAGPLSETGRHHAILALEESFRKFSRPIGGKGYVHRDELYER